MGRPKTNRIRKLDPTLELPNEPKDLQELIDWARQFRTTVSDSYMKTADRVENLIMMDEGLDRRPEPQGSGRLFYDTRDQILYIDRLKDTGDVDWYPINQIRIEDPASTDNAPVASFTYEVIDKTVTFTDTSTGEITSWEWDFGDHTGSILEDPVHTYGTPGTYDVQLIVTGPGGQSIATASITVGGATPPPTPLKADFSWSNAEATLIVVFTDRSTGDISSYLWDFGDGQTSTIKSPTHTYGMQGKYFATLKITESGTGTTATKTKQIMISGGGGGEEPPPTGTDDSLFIYRNDPTPYNFPGNTGQGIEPFSFNQFRLDDGSYSGTKITVKKTSLYRLKLHAKFIPPSFAYANGYMSLFVQVNGSVYLDAGRLLIGWFKNTDGMNPVTKTQELTVALNIGDVLEFYISDGFLKAGIYGSLAANYEHYFSMEEFSSKALSVTKATILQPSSSGLVGSSADHGGLAGLFDDDHQQYIIGYRPYWSELTGGAETDLHTHSLSQIRGDVTVVNQVYYEVAERDSYILVTIEDDAGVVLPDATMEDERVIHIKRTSNSMYDVTVSVTGGGLVEGDTAFILRKKYDAITCVAINGEWWIY